LCLNAASIVNAMPAPFFVHGAAQMTLNADRRRKARNRHSCGEMMRVASGSREENAPRSQLRF
jgi:hypothetical protein